jgi:hypothetical protein
MCSFAMIDVMNVFSLSCGALNLILIILPHIVHDPVVSSLLLCATCFFFIFVTYAMVDPFQIPHLRPAQYKRSRLPRSRRTVNRPYGGVLSGTAVRER